MSNGAVGTLHANALASRTPYMDSFCLHGSHGSVVEAGGGLRYATATGVVTKAWGDQHEGFVTARDPDDPSEDPFVRQLLAFADAVAGVAPLPFNSARDNFNTIACLDAIAASLRSGRTEPVAAWESTV
jgi:predicted dehydrogenase